MQTTGAWPQDQLPDRDVFTQKGSRTEMEEGSEGPEEDCRPSNANVHQWSASHPSHSA